MEKIELFRFEAWSSLDDAFHKSSRWGTKDGIKRISAVPIEDTRVVVDSAAVQFEYDGITIKGLPVNVWVLLG